MCGLNENTSNQNFADDDEVILNTDFVWPVEKDFSWDVMENALKKEGMKFGIEIELIEMEGPDGEPLIEARGKYKKIKKFMDKYYMNVNNENIKKVE
jgi:hypothetical protein